MIKKLKKKKDWVFLVYSSLRQEGTMMEKRYWEKFEGRKRMIWSEQLFHLFIERNNLRSSNCYLW